jgi:protein required for attachment to host cells
MMKPTRTWILVADGARARVLENTGPGKGVSEVAGMEFAEDALRNREIMSDRPGRSFESADQSRHAMEPPTDPKQLAETAFVTGLVEMLDDKFKAGEFDRLVLVAAPRALGDIRKALPKELAQVVYGELAKDLTKVPNTEMEKHLGEVMAV